MLEKINLLSESQNVKTEFRSSIRTETIFLVFLINFNEIFVKINELESAIKCALFDYKCVFQSKKI